MARIRSLPPDVASDPKLASVSIGAALLAVLSWCWHDDAGNLPYDPERLRGWVFPLRDRSQLAIEAWLAELIAVDWYRPFADKEGRLFLFCVEFLAGSAEARGAGYQKVDNPSKPRFDRQLATPVDPRTAILSTGSRAREGSRALSSPREGSSAERKGGEGRGREGNGEKRSEAVGRDLQRPAQPASASAAAAGKATAISLPASPAIANFLEVFYGPPEPRTERRLDIERQLAALLNGGVVHAKQRVAARDLGHLEAECAETVRRRGMIANPDRAIVFLIKQISDNRDLPAAQRADAWRAEQRESARDVEQGERQIAGAVERFRAEQPNAYAKILEAANQQFPGDGMAPQMARDAYVLSEIRNLLELRTVAAASAAQAISPSPGGGPSP